MNAVMKAVDELKFRIPFEVLREAFKDDYTGWRKSPVSLDEQMLSKVIRPRVIVDTNLVGGEMVIISLNGLAPIYSDVGVSVYEIPASLTQFRTIISVLSVSYLPYAASSYGSLGSGGVQPSSMNDVSSAAQRVGDAMSSIPVISNAVAEIIAHNTVSIRDQFRATGMYQMRCVLANDENLNNISPRSYHAFATLCELAVKAYIYNKLIIRIDQAFLQGGQELGAMKDYVQGLSDSNQMYLDHLRNVWQVTAYCNDSSNYNRFIKLMCNPGI